ncbi:MAG: hypothetical protein E7348_01325 [Clostridiales bacterium]|nr:hypothetical protein [Clostridiales bacterium]
MQNLILEPLKYYVQHAKGSHERNIDEYFTSLVEKSKIDVQENRKTAELFRKQDKIASKTKDKISKFKGLKTFLIILSVLSVIALLVGIFALTDTAQIVTIIVSVLLLIFSILFIVLKLNKEIKNFEEIYKKQRQIADETYRKALSQMQPLNALFSENDTFNLIEKVVPNLKFNKEYSVELDQNFRNNYDFESDTNDDTRSVVNTVSGNYNKNPFLFYRHLNHYMSTKTYTGTRVITWRERVSDGKGGTRTITRSQTLVATVTKPFPMYAYATALNYGHQTAPDLSFSRRYKHAEDWSENKVERHIRKGKKKLRKKAEKTIGQEKQFTEMANSEFDTLFGATDRDHEVQFRVMFSPLAQINMVNLMRSEDGYGDDFSFVKNGKHNYIVTEHSQNWDMDTSPQKYYSYDIDLAKKQFSDINSQYFKSMYFDLAPIFAIPAYHEQPNSVFEKYQKTKNNYTEYEYEILANVIGADKFMHPMSRTQSILKAEFLYSKNDTDCVQVTAHSFTSEPRVDIVPLFGGDGRLHNVPVRWDEYIPVVNTRIMVVKKLGLDGLTFDSKRTSMDARLFDTPYGYYHGLFARILGNDDVEYIDNALNKI